MKNKLMTQKLIILTSLLIILNCSPNAGKYNSTSEIEPLVATHIKIETAAGGAGTEVLSSNLTNGSPITLYAVARTASGNFVADVSVDWSETGSLGYLTPGTGSSTIYSPNGDNGDTSISASHLTLNPDSTGALTVTYDVETVSGLTLWLKADSLIGSLNDDDDVSLWEDKNGSTRSVASLGAGQNPTLKTNRINGLPVLRFNSTESDGFISTFPISDILTNSEYTYFIIFSATSISTDDTDAWRNNALLIDSNGSLGATLRSGTPLVQSYNWDGVSAETTKSITLSTYNLFTSYHESGNIYSQLNGDTASTAVSGDTDDITGSLTIGGGHAPSGFFNGDIAEIIIYNTSLSATDRTTVQDYLCSKYNLTCP